MRYHCSEFRNEFANNSAFNGVIFNNDRWNFKVRPNSETLEVWNEIRHGKSDLTKRWVSQLPPDTQTVSKSNLQYVCTILPVFDKNIFFDRYLCIHVSSLLAKNQRWTCALFWMKYLACVLCGILWYATELTARGGGEGEGRERMFAFLAGTNEVCLFLLLLVQMKQ